MFLTVHDAILKVFPRGTVPDPPDGKPPDITQPPLWPPDLFAVTGHLLYRSAAYQRIIACDRAREAPKGSLPIKRSYVDGLRRVGQAWSLDPSCPARVAEHWATLIASGNEPLCALDAAVSKPSPWWKSAFSLMAIADEACVDVGYRPRDGLDASRQWVVRLANRLLIGSTPPRSGLRNLRHVKHHPSITSQHVDQDVVCVQPKARTPDVGCSLRNLSHNVALLPARGVMRVHWLTPPAPQPVEETAPLNLLLVPFPYALATDWFASRMASKPGADAAWGWFSLRQGWLEGDTTLLIDLVRALLIEAESHETVHGIVFPELALSYEAYEQLAIVLRDHHPSVQFLVAGSSSNCAGEVGNFALASHFFDDDAPSSATTPARMMATVSRAKHHRWSLEASQIAAYDLAASFPSPSGELRWWEDIPLKPRELHVNAMRGASVFTVMICEDLARSDPAHEPLRAIGPNLVFVLLMDGPQLEWRWAARYSTGLAEDPGSSVLTLTSRALVERWNRSKAAKDRSWSVGIWKDEANRALELSCPPGKEAVLLRLRGRRQVERTIDGRDNTQTFAWHRLGDPHPVSLDRHRDRPLLDRLGL